MNVIVTFLTFATLCWLLMAYDYAVSDRLVNCPGTKNRIKLPIDDCFDPLYTEDSRFFETAKKFGCSFKEKEDLWSKGEAEEMCLYLKEFSVGGKFKFKG